MSVPGMLGTHPCIFSLPAQMWLFMPGKPSIGLKLAHIAHFLLARHPWWCVLYTFFVVLVSSESGRCNWVLHHAGWLCVVVLWQ